MTPNRPNILNAHRPITPIPAISHRRRRAANGESLFSSLYSRRPLARLCRSSALLSVPVPCYLCPGRAASWLLRCGRSLLSTRRLAARNSHVF